MSQTIKTLLNNKISLNLIKQFGTDVPKRSVLDYLKRFLDTHKNVASGVRCKMSSHSESASKNLTGHTLHHQNEDCAILGKILSSNKLQISGHLNAIQTRHYSKKKCGKTDIQGCETMENKVADFERRFVKCGNPWKKKKNTPRERRRFSTFSSQQNIITYKIPKRYRSSMKKTGDEKNIKLNKDERKCRFEGSKDTSYALKLSKSGCVAEQDCGRCFHCKYSTTASTPHIAHVLTMNRIQLTKILEKYLQEIRLECRRSSSVMVLNTKEHNHPLTKHSFSSPNISVIRTYCDSNEGGSSYASKMEESRQCDKKKGGCGGGKGDKKASDCGADKKKSSSTESKKKESDKKDKSCKPIETAKKNPCEELKKKAAKEKPKKESKPKTCPPRPMKQSSGSKCDSKKKSKKDKKKDCGKKKGAASKKSPAAAKAKKVECNPSTATSQAKPAEKKPTECKLPKQKSKTDCKPKKAKTAKPAEKKPSKCKLPKQKSKTDCKPKKDKTAKPAGKKPVECKSSAPKLAECKKPAEKSKSAECVSPPKPKADTCKPKPSKSAECVSPPKPKADTCKPKPSKSEVCKKPSQTTAADSKPKESKTTDICEKILKKKSAADCKPKASKSSDPCAKPSQTEAADCKSSPAKAADPCKPQPKAADCKSSPAKAADPCKPQPKAADCKSSPAKAADPCKPQPKAAECKQAQSKSASCTAASDKKSSIAASASSLTQKAAVAVCKKAAAAAVKFCKPAAKKPPAKCVPLKLDCDTIAKEKGSSSTCNKSACPSVKANDVDNCNPACVPPVVLRDIEKHQQQSSSSKCGPPVQDTAKVAQIKMCIPPPPSPLTPAEKHSEGKIKSKLAAEIESCKIPECQENVKVQAKKVTQHMSIQVTPPNINAGSKTSIVDEKNVSAKPQSIVVQDAKPTYIQVINPTGQIQSKLVFGPPIQDNAESKICKPLLRTAHQINIAKTGEQIAMAAACGGGKGGSADKQQKPECDKICELTKLAQSNTIQCGDPWKGKSSKCEVKKPKCPPKTSKTCILTLKNNYLDNMGLVNVLPAAIAKQHPCGRPPKPTKPKCKKPNPNSGPPFKVVPPCDPCYKQGERKCISRFYTASVDNSGGDGIAVTSGLQGIDLVLHDLIFLHPRGVITGFRKSCTCKDSCNQPSTANKEESCEEKLLRLVTGHATSECERMKWKRSLSRKGGGDRQFQVVLKRNIHFGLIFNGKKRNCGRDKCDKSIPGGKPPPPRKKPACKQPVTDPPNAFPSNKRSRK